MHIDRLAVIAIFVFCGPTRFIEGAMSPLMDAPLDLMTGTSHLISSTSDQVRDKLVPP